jgi:hypothetical protein
VTATDPRDTDVGFATDLPITITFSTAMDPNSLNANTFFVQTGINAADGGMNSIAGTIAVNGNIATFTPSTNLDVSTTYTVVITPGATDTAGNPLAGQFSLMFNTHSRPAAVNLGSAGNYVILAESTITNVPPSAITGDLGLSPLTSVTGFALALDASGQFSTDMASPAPQITGRVFISNYAVPTPINLTTAVTDMTTAFTDAAGRPADVTELGAGEIGGKTLSPGVYKWGTGLSISTDVHLEGSPTDVFIFEVAQTLTLAPGKNVFLSGGALPKNIFWQVSGDVTLGTTSHFEGVILSSTQILPNTGASVNGRLLAQTAVNLISNTIVAPAP